MSVVATWMLGIFALSPLITLFVLHLFVKIDSFIAYYRLVYAVTAIIWIAIWIVQELRTYFINGAFAADTDFRAAALTGVVMLVFVISKRQFPPKDVLLELEGVWLLCAIVFKIMLS
ncbi:hypothetical protein HC928_20840 [bacterium]|nr:hypothetical protein [bacterium]